MPPLQRTEKIFLSQLLEKDISSFPEGLDKAVDSESLSILLGEINTQTDALQLELLKTLSSQIDSFSSSFLSSQELQSTLTNVVNQLKSTENQVTNTHQTVSDTLQDYQSCLFASKRSELKKEALSTLYNIIKKITHIDSLVVKHSFSLAVTDYLEANKNLESIEKEWKGIHCYEWTRQKMQTTRRLLIDKLEEDIQMAIQYEDHPPAHSLRILKQLQIEGVTVRVCDIFSSMDKLELLPMELSSVKKHLFKHIFDPYFESVRSDLFTQTYDNGSVGTGGVLQIKRMGDDEDDHEQVKMDPLLMMNQVQSILAFLHQHLWEEADNVTFTTLFGNLILPDLVQRMISCGLAPAIPSSQEGLSQFGQVTQAVEAFENACIHQYKFQSLDSDTSTLSSFVHNIDQHYAKKRREKILLEARKVMLRRLYDAEMVEVKQQQGHLNHYQITQTPQLLAVLLTDTLTEAYRLLNSHPISAAKLTEGMQDALDMFRALMPSYHRSHYLTSPAHALIFRNDCHWLAYQLPLQDKLMNAFPDLEGHLAAAAEQLRALGNTWHEYAMMQQMNWIKTALDSMDGFMGVAETPKAQQECEKTFTRIIESIGRFASETRSVVDETLFLDMMGRTVDSLLDRLIRDIEDLHDIGAEESHIIARTLNSLAQLVGAFDLPGRDATDTFVAELVPSWEKFWLFKDILEMNMRDIMQAYRRDDLHMFEKSELVGLLCALFADSDLRTANINEIKTGQIHHLDPPSKEEEEEEEEEENLVNPNPRGLDYQLDENDLLDETETGWGDADQDLFSTESDVVPTIKEQEGQKRNTLLMNPDEMDMDDTSGWDDGDDDLFNQMDDITAAPVPSAGEKAPEKDVPERKKEQPTSSHLPSLDIEELGEEGGWEGWDDGEDDLFKEEDSLR
ncbi:hypothetical protein K501DRAFT_287769 [Backusella circina FSU 941]|nr:hypothetical protein K501DRAFT_287769 [Backusella circina FSU 941]